MKAIGFVWRIRVPGQERDDTADAVMNAVELLACQAETGGGGAVEEGENFQMNLGRESVERWCAGCWDCQCTAYK